jgi:hypothetical protein
MNSSTGHDKERETKEEEKILEMNSYFEILFFE